MQQNESMQDGINSKGVSFGFLTTAEKSGFKVGGLIKLKSSIVVQ